MPLLSTPTVPVGDIRNPRDAHEKFFTHPKFCHDIANKLRDPRPVAGQVLTAEAQEVVAQLADVATTPKPVVS
jgi:hypothetical protein